MEAEQQPKIMILPRPFEPLWDNETTEIVERSGRSSGKTTTNEMRAIEFMMTSKRHNIWYCRAEQEDLRKGNFSSFMTTIQLMGLEEEFEASLSPLQIRNKKKGSVCYFSALNGKTADDVGRTKGFVPQGGTLAMFIVDEANEVKDRTHITAGETTATKFLLPYGKIVYAYNPPPVLTHWANAFFEKKISNGAKLIYSTFKDIWDVLQPKARELILDMKRNDYQEFEYWYLGLQKNLQGLVFPDFTEKNLITLEILKLWAESGWLPQFMIYGVDSGITHDPTAVCCWAKYTGGILVKIATFYFEPEKIVGKGKELLSSDQAKLILEEYRKLHQKWKELGIPLPTPANEYWVFDSASITRDLQGEMRRLTGFKCFKVDKKEVEVDIRRVADLYKQEVLKVLDTEDNKASLDEIRTFYRDRDNKIPQGQADHTIDADKYATRFYCNQYYNIYGKN